MMAEPVAVPEATDDVASTADGKKLVVGPGVDQMEVVVEDRQGKGEQNGEGKKEDEVANGKDGEVADGDGEAKEEGEEVKEGDEEGKKGDGEDLMN